MDINAPVTSFTYPCCGIVQYTGYTCDFYLWTWEDIAPGGRNEHTWEELSALDIFWQPAESEIDEIRWYFDDGTESGERAPTKYFYNAGYHTITCSITSIYDDIVTLITQVYAEYPMRDGIQVLQIPESTDPTEKSVYPFVLSVSSVQYGNNCLDLYAQCSNSIPYDATLQNKYSHLKPQWHFEDSDGNIINQICLDGLPVCLSGDIVGEVGEVEFYYVDDRSTSYGEPVIIWATLNKQNAVDHRADSTKFCDCSRYTQEPGHMNSKVSVGIPYFINELVPASLNITRNGIADIYDPQWVGAHTFYTITVEGSSAQSENCIDNSSDRPVMFDYPASNAIGTLAGPITSEIFASTEITQTHDPVTQYFQAYDSDGFYTGGFVRGNISPATSATNASLSAIARVIYDPPRPNATPFAWISNPNNRTLNKIYSPYVNLSSHCLSGMLNYYDEFHLIHNMTMVYDVPYLTAIPYSDVMGLTGFGGIYGIAVDPCGNVWAADAEMDSIYKFNTQGVLLSTITPAIFVSAISTNFGLTVEPSSIQTPAGIALDSALNVWITFTDSAYVMKLSSDGTPTVFIPLTSNIAGDYSELIYKPAQVDTDTQDNIWVAYSFNLSSCIYKYDSDGNYLAEADLSTFGISATPIDVMVDGADDSVWATLAFSHQTSGAVAKFDSTGALIGSMEYVQPGYLTLDMNKNAWFTYDYDKVAAIDSAASSELYNLTMPDIPSAAQYDQALEGITCDASDRIWVIDSITNSVHRLSATSPNISATFAIWPDNNLSWYNDLGYIYTIEDETNRSAQAFGDWMGWRWIQKYAPITTDTTPITATIYGQSNFFDIKSFRNEYEIRRFNDSWNAAQQMRDYALPEPLNNKYKFWTYYIGGIVGTDADEYQTLGRQNYEKIANYVQNHSDIDTANIDQLYSLAEMIDMPIDDYNFAYPGDLHRLMNIFSIQHSRLWGGRDKCNRNYTDKGWINENSTTRCEVCNNYHLTNRGGCLDMNSYIVSAGVPIIARNLWTKYFEKINPLPAHNGVYLYQLTGFGLEESIYDNYQFYTFIDRYSDILTEGVINWTDPYTTLSENMSTIEEWYSEGGLIEEMLIYTLYHGLNLLED